LQSAYRKRAAVALRFLPEKQHMQALRADVTLLGDVMATLAELIAKIAHALNISYEHAERIVLATLHPE